MHFDDEQNFPLAKERMLMELQAALEQRYSCRSFLPDAPTQEQVNAILEAGRIAPTARNLQPQRIWVITKKEDLEKIYSCTPCQYGAPVVFIIGYDTDVAMMHMQAREPWSFGNVDSASALVQMLLKATDLGLATCWIGLYDDMAIRANFPIPENVELRALVFLGTPAEDGEPSPRHTGRLPLDQTVTGL